MTPNLTALAMKRIITLAVTVFFFMSTASAQMREIYLNTSQTTNTLCSLSFYSPSQGFVAFSSFIGFTTDSGRTMSPRIITNNNVNYNGFSVNLTFGFDIMGIKAFDQNTLIAYGDYGAVPAILYSTDGGNTFTLIFQSQANPNQISLTNGIAAMDFAPGTNTGFAVDEDRILETTNNGLTWSVNSTNLSSYYNYVQTLDVNNVFVGCTYNNAASKLQKTTNGGSSWQLVTLPAPTSTAKLSSVFFLNASTGWLVMEDNGTGYFYKTTDGGNSWVQLNNVQANPFPANKMKFVDANTGFAVDAQNTTYKTSNGGAVWEPLQRNDNLTYSGISTNDIQLMGSNQLWAGWAGLQLLELSTDAGGTPLPKAFFYIDTTGVATTGNVQLTDYSATTYSYRWFLNGVQISTAYNSSYAHDTARLKDTVTLIVSNGVNSDTATSYAYFNPPPPPLPAPTITSFSPSSGATGDYVIIYGTNLYVNSTIPTVTIGGVAVSTVNVYTSGNLAVIVGPGASGNIVVTTPGGSATAGPFTYIPPPQTDSFSPASATLGDVVTIYGHDFTGATAVKFGDTTASSFTVLSDSVITATVWLGASGAVSVTRPSGTGQAAGFTFIAPPPPVITTLSTFTGSPGTLVKITGTHFYGTVSVTIGGVAANSFTVVSDNEVDAIVGFDVSGEMVVTTLFGSGSIAGFVIMAPPTISSFAPASGPIGTTVTIAGANFSPVASQNIVYFGAVRGSVSAATANQLTVQVPYGASFQPISVTVKNLTGYSLYPFTVTSPGAVWTLTDSSFDSKTPTAFNGNPQGNLLLADLDGDGKPDLVSSQGLGDNISVSRNLCSPGTVLFDNLIDLPVSAFPIYVTTSDIDGDGRLDLVAAGNYISVLKNTSSGIGQISFAPAVNIPGIYNPPSVVMADLNGDGKPDMVTVYNNSVLVLGNISTPDTIAFTSPVSYSYAGSNLSGGLAIADVDGDGKPDIVVIDAYAGAFVLRNIGANGSLSFAPSTTFELSPLVGAAYATTVTVGDLDGDGKPDLSVAFTYNSAFTILRNTSTPGNVSFAPHLDFTSEDNFTNNVAIQDLDGDGKLDLAIVKFHADSVMVYKNISTVGNIAFSSSLEYDASPNPFTAIAGDVDLDGKPDIMTNNLVLRNRSTVSTLPVVADTNYRIQVVNNTCVNKDDGKIIVTFAQALSYGVDITGSGVADSVHVTGASYEQDSLPAGVYQVCFTVDSLPGYLQCFTVNLTQPKDLSVLSVVAPTDDSLSITLGGSSVYTIDLNGTSFQTNASNITLPLQSGTNTLTVQTPLVCQGTVTRTFFVPTGSSGIKSIPNPVVSTAMLYLPGADTRVQIEVFSPDGKMMPGSGAYTVGADRSVQLNLSRFASGLYLVHVQGITLNASIKLIKTY
jgi:photosystem II stability/assembly factor-like uncharacterized protein